MAFIIIFSAIISYINPTTHAQAQDDQWEKIKERGELRVGLSADYAPYEFEHNVNGKTEYAGIDIELAKKDGSYHSRYLRSNFEGGSLIEVLAQRSRELAFLGHKYRDKSDTFKALLAANIAFADDEKFIRVLLSKNVNYYQLFSYARAVKSIKKITAIDFPGNSISFLISIN